MERAASPPADRGGDNNIRPSPAVAKKTNLKTDTLRVLMDDPSDTLTQLAAMIPGNLF
jgi:hypothetical protein